MRYSTPLDRLFHVFVTHAFTHRIAVFSCPSRSIWPLDDGQDAFAVPRTMYNGPLYVEQANESVNCVCFVHNVRSLFVARILVLIVSFRVLIREFNSLWCYVNSTAHGTHRTYSPIILVLMSACDATMMMMTMIMMITMMAR